MSLHPKGIAIARRLLDTPTGCSYANGAFYPALQHVVVGWHKLKCDIVLAVEISHLTANKLFCAIMAKGAWHAASFGNPILQHCYRTYR